MGREVFIAQLYWQGLQPATSCLARTSFTYHHTARSFFNWMSNFVGEITLLSRAVDHYRSKTSNEPAKWSSNCNQRSVVDLKHWLNWTRMRLIRVHESRSTSRSSRGRVESSVKTLHWSCEKTANNKHIRVESMRAEWEPCTMSYHSELNLEWKLKTFCTRNCQN